MVKLIINTWIMASIVLLNLPVLGQNTLQTIKGNITDKASKTSLIGAAVMLMGHNKGAMSNIGGDYKINNITPGRYDIKASYLGYKEAIISNVLVTSGKQVVLDIELEENSSNLGEAVIKGTKSRETLNEMSVVSSRSFSMEEVNRYSGGIGDPARLASNFAGVVTPNDQRNDLIIRGNSPTGILWRVDGLNVSNLNHFAVLGSNGGPVTALNTNVLKNSDFITSAFAPEYGNATSGVFDLGFRKGNAEKQEHTLQFGAFTGIEAMTEGPIGKKGEASYIVAYRYSFTGLAQKAGFSIGTAASPNYQDISFKITSNKTKAGVFALFGLGGISKIDFLHDKIDSTDVFADPSRDSYNTSTIGLLGVSHFIQLNKKSYLKTIIGSNYTESNYDEDSLDIAQKNTPIRILKVASKEIHYTLNTSFSTKINAKFSLKTGIIAEVLDLNLQNSSRRFTTYWKKAWDYNDNTLLLQGYLQAKYWFSEKISFTGGLHSQYLTLNNSSSIEPRIAFKLQADTKNAFTVGYGWHEQMQPLTVYFFESRNPNGSYNHDNRNVGFSRSQHWVAGYEFMPANDWKIKTEVYCQSLNNVPVSRVISSFSVQNEGANFIPTQQENLINKGAGTNYGLELTVEKYFTKGYYGLLTASVYDAKYKGSDDIERNSAFNGKYTFNFLVGKEFKIGTGKQNAFTIDTKFTSAGGRYYTPVDLKASQIAQDQILQGDSKAFSEQLPNYYRFDLKFGYRRNGKIKKISQSWSLDLQNLFNHKNVFAQQYNRVSNQINTTYQNGFLPNFVYKFQF